MARSEQPNNMIPRVGTYRRTEAPVGDYINGTDEMPSMANGIITVDDSSENAGAFVVTGPDMIIKMKNMNGDVSMKGLTATVIRQGFIIDDLIYRIRKLECPQEIKPDTDDIVEVK